MSMLGTLPSIILAVIPAFKTVKLYNTSYNVIIANPNNISWSNAILQPMILFPAVLLHPILETQYHPIIVEKNIHVETREKFSNGMKVFCIASPITYVPCSIHSIIVM